MRVPISVYDVTDRDFGVSLGWVSSDILRLEDFQKIVKAIDKSTLPPDLPYGTPCVWDSETGSVKRMDGPDPDCPNCDGTGGALAYGRCGECWQDHS